MMNAVARDEWAADSGYPLQVQKMNVFMELESSCFERVVVFGSKIQKSLNLEASEGWLSHIICREKQTESRLLLEVA